MRLQVAKIITMEAKGLFKSESAIKICRALVILIGVISSPCTQPGFFSLLGPRKVVQGRGPG